MAKKKSYKTKSKRVDQKKVKGLSPFKNLLSNYTHLKTPIVLTFFTFFISVFAPQIPTFESSTSILFIVAILNSTVIFFGALWYQKNWVKQFVLVSTLSLFIFNFLLSLGIQFELLQQPYWTSIAGYTIIPCASFIWLSFIKYGNATIEPNKTSEKWNSPRLQKIYFALAGGSIILCTLLIFYRLGYFNLGIDEPLMYRAAVGYNKSGMEYFEQGYTRVWFNSIIIAKSFLLFGTNEWAARLPAALMGVLFVALSIYVFKKGLKNPWIALFIPLLCFLQFRFTYLFRIVRMYAFLLPLFLAGIFLFYQILVVEREYQLKFFPKISSFYNKWLRLDLKYIIPFGVIVFLLGIFHELSVIILPIAALTIIFLTIFTRQKRFFALSTLVFAIGIIAYFIIFVIESDSLYFFRVAAKKFSQETEPILPYYTFYFSNGLPMQTGIALFLGSLGLLFTKISYKQKLFYLISFVAVALSFVLMTYLIYSKNQGRDYRYIAHFTPFIIGIVLFTLYQLGFLVYRSKKIGYLLLILPIFYSILFFKQNTDFLYRSNPFHPQYKIAYKSIIDNYQEGEFIMGFDFQSIYFNAQKVSNNNFIKIPKGKKYTLKQLKKDLRKTKKGWIVWPRIKAHNVRNDVTSYLYKNFDHIHGFEIDDTYIEVFYYDWKKRKNKSQ